MPNHPLIEALIKAIKRCDLSAIGNLVNDCLASLNPETIQTFIEQAKASCANEDFLSIITYYLELCSQGASDSTFKPPVVPGMSCFFASKQLYSLIALLPGELLTGFLDGMDENLTSRFLKRFVDPWVKYPCLRAVVRCCVLSLTDSTIALGRLGVQLFTEYLVRGELDEELPYWQTFLWNSLASHLIVNSTLFVSLELMKILYPDDWKERFASQFLRMRIIPQLAKLMLTDAWATCRAKGLVGYLINVLGQILGCISISKCIREDDYNVMEATSGLIKNILERMNQLAGRVEQNEREMQQLQEQLSEIQRHLSPVENSASVNLPPSNQNPSSGTRNPFASNRMNAPGLNFFNGRAKNDNYYNIGNPGARETRYYDAPPPESNYYNTSGSPETYYDASDASGHFYDEIVAESSRIRTQR